MQPNDWDQFVLRIPVNKDIAAIYHSWTTQEGLESWFLRQAAFTRKDGTTRDRHQPIEAGDTYEWLWHGWSDEVVEKGTILEVNGKDFIKFSFGQAGNVSVSIKPEGSDTIVELLQSEIPTDEESQVYYHLGCTKGWLFYLTNLKSILEGGIDLRNRKVELKNVINS
jgi:uncharacterized protein YndB with AHSA1/START domain